MACGKVINHKSDYRIATTAAEAKYAQSEVMEFASRAPTRIDFLELLSLRQEKEDLLSQVRPLFCYIQS